MPGGRDARELLFRETGRVAGSEHIFGQLCFPGRRIPCLPLSQFDNLFGAWNIHGAKTQFARLGIRKRKTYAVSLHNLANARANFLKQVGQVQLSDDTIRQFKEEL